MKTNIFTLIILITLPIFSQSKPFYTSYTWDENPAYKMASDATEPMIALKDKYVIEFAYSDDKSLTEYYLEHQVLWLNSDDKIESYNKIYLPYSSTSELLVNKARVITKDGKIIELDDSKILTAQDEETGKKYKYFAFEGIQKGSFIEYYYVEKKYPNYKGTAFRIQTSYKKENIEFDLFSPTNLIFKFKSYNSIPLVTQDTLIKNKLHWQLSLEKLNSLEKEEQAPFEASRVGLIYKLDRNTLNNSNDISSYGTVSQNLYGYYYDTPSKKEQTLLKKFISEAIPKTEKDEESKIRTLDRYIKTNIFFSEGNSNELKDLEDVLVKKVANTPGMIKLYVALLNTLQIKHEIVITSDREQIKFDQEFEANNFLTDFLFYFPKSKSYLSPTKFDTRYGFPPPNLMDNYGLFIKEIIIGEFKSGIGKIKYIEPITADKTIDNMLIDVRFDEKNISKNFIKLNRSFSGYYAMSIHPYMHLIKEKDRDELLDGLAKSMNKDVIVTNKEVVNENPELFGIQPIEFKMDIESEVFTEKAGEKILFKVGDLIGQQIQMYQEKERTLPLENEFKRSYYRTITIKLPTGYEVGNLDDLNMENSYQQDGEEVLSFKSFYEIKDDILKITADEHYRINIIEAPIVEEYRKVINSAADFNKIILVLQPKS